MFPHKFLFEICRLLSYWPTNMKFCLTFFICRLLVQGGKGFYCDLL